MNEQALREVLNDLWDGGYGGSPEDDDNGAAVAQKREDIDAALVRLAAAVLPLDAREAKCARLCMEAVRAREAADTYGIVTKRDYAAVEEQKLRAMRAGEAHAAAVAALKALEETK